MTRKYIVGGYGDDDDNDWDDADWDEHINVVWLYSNDMCNSHRPLAHNLLIEYEC